MKKCKQCGIVMSLKSNSQLFCSRVCRSDYNKEKLRNYRNERQREKTGKYEPGKIQCLICHNRYHKVCTHIYYTHKLTSREYKEMFGKDVGKGILSEKVFEKHSRKNKENKDIVWKNLEKGKKHRYKKGQKGVGVYSRSEETLERLKNLCKYKN